MRMPERDPVKLQAARTFLTLGWLIVLLTLPFGLVFLGKGDWQRGLGFLLLTPVGVGIMYPCVRWFLKTRGS